MYAIYNAKQENEQRSYHFCKTTSLFGCNAGMIPRQLRLRLSQTDTQPYPWHLPLGELLAEHGEALLIDLKPNNKDATASRSLYELLDVWGYSAYGWTPAMLRLRALVIDGDPTISDPKNFTIDLEYHPDPIYSYLYLAGSVVEGEIVGKWTAPRASPTNSALLWPYALTYFVNEIKRLTPSALQAGAA